MDVLLALCIGIGLSAACGFRIFVPMLVMSIAANSGHLDLAYGFEWIGSPVALVAFAIATAIEIAAYYVPWVDNLLDTIATPAAVIAGTVATAAAVSDTSPLLQWSLAIIAGGGIAAGVQVATGTLRAASTALTGGLGNSAVSTGEAGGSLLLAFLAVAVPVVAAAVVLILFAWAGHKLYQRYKKREAIHPVAA